MTELATKILARWVKLPDGSLKRPGLTCKAGRTCLSIGERVAHSHYAWAKDETWAVYGDMSNAGMLK